MYAAKSSFQQLNTITSALAKTDTSRDPVEFSMQSECKFDMVGFIMVKYAGMMEVVCTIDASDLGSG